MSGVTFRRKFTKILEKDETIETDEITEGSSFLEDMKKVFRLSKGRHMLLFILNLVSLHLKNDFFL